MIYFGGDSYTYGIELKNPEVDRFSALIEKNMNITTKNDSWGGASNDRITRKFLEYINKKGKPDIVFIMWAPIHRTEQYAPHHDVWEERDGFRQVRAASIFPKQDKKLNGTQKRWRHNVRELSATQKWFIELYHTSAQINNYIQNVSTIQAVCSAGNIPLVMTNCDYNLTIREIDDYVKNAKEKYTKERVKLLSKKKWYIDNEWGFKNWAAENNFPIGPQHHPLEEAHKELANNLTNYFTEILNGSN